MLDDIRVHVRFKLSALWSSVIFCYVYGDYFELYQPGKLHEMLAGKTALGAATQDVLLGMSALMAIPSVMVFLSLALPAAASRWTNVVLGIAYSVIMILAIWGSWRFYVFFGFVEIALTVSVVSLALTWPKRSAI